MSDKLFEAMTALLGKQDENMEDIILGLLNAARNEGWQYRNSEKGTRYEIGEWVDDEDGEEDQKWSNTRDAHSYYDAWSTAQRWGCEYRAIRHNPFVEEK